MDRLYTLLSIFGTNSDTWSKEKRLFVTSFGFLCVALYAPNNKILLVLSLVYLLGLIKIFRNIRHSLLFAAIFLLPFQGGKGIDFLVVAPEYVYGNIPFIMSVSLSLTGFMTILLMYSVVRNRLLKIDYPAISRFAPHDSALIVMVFSLVISSVLSPMPLLSFLLLLQFTLYIFLYYYIRQYSLQTWIASHMLPLISALSCFEGFISILQFINKGPLGKLIENAIDPSISTSLLHAASEDLSFVRIQGTFSHPNSLGFFTAMAAPLLFYYSGAKTVSHFGRKLSAVGCIASIASLILSASRLSWIVVFFEMLFLYRFVLRHTISEQVKHLYKFTVIICVMVLPIIIIPRLSQFAVTFSSDGGASFRWKLIQNSILITSQNPFGVGLGTFPKILLETIGGFTSFPTQPHTIIFQILVAAGPIGLISFLYLLSSVSKRIAYSLRLILSGANASRAIFSIPLVAFLLLAQFYPILTEQQIIGWFWIFFAIIV